MAVIEAAPKRRAVRDNALDRVLGIVEHYGFKPAEKHITQIANLDSKFLKQTKSPLTIKECLELPAMKRVSSLPKALQSGTLRKTPAEPLLLYSISSQLRGILFHEEHEKTPGPWCALSLETIGLKESISEALLLRTALTILKETNTPNAIVRLNSLGDRESRQRYTRDYVAYYRSVISSVHLRCRELLRENPFALLECTHDSCSELAKHAPRAISFLSEPSRRHLKEIVEYLEACDVAYRIDDALFVQKFAYSKTVFEIERADEAETAQQGSILLAQGGRYDDFARQLGARNDIPAAGITLLLRADAAQAAMRDPIPRSPRAYFIQIGPEAQRQGLMVLETLRQASIPVHQPLGTEKLSARLAVAERLGIPFTLIMGHKEAMEGNIIVRHTDTRAQETVPIKNLATYAKLVS